MSPRKGAWIQTHSGKPFWPLDPRPAEVDIDDIAWSLSMVCRWNGHCRQFLSVGDHSLRVMARAPQELKLAALLHDAAEAYLGDLVRPLKALPEFEFFRDAERRLLTIIGEKYGVTIEEFDAVAGIDNAQLGTEALALMSPLHMPETWAYCTGPNPTGRLVLASYHWESGDSYSPFREADGNERSNPRATGEGEADAAGA